MLANALPRRVQFPCGFIAVGSYLSMAEQDTSKRFYFPFGSKTQLCGLYPTGMSYPGHLQFSSASMRGSDGQRVEFELFRGAPFIHLNLPKKILTARRQSPTRAFQHCAVGLRHLVYRCLYERVLGWAFCHCVSTSSVPRGFSQDSPEEES